MVYYFVSYGRHSAHRLDVQANTAVLSLSYSDFGMQLKSIENWFGKEIIRFDRPLAIHWANMYYDMYTNNINKSLVIDQKREAVRHAIHSTGQTIQLCRPYLIITINKSTNCIVSYFVMSQSSIECSST